MPMARPITTGLLGVTLAVVSAAVATAVCTAADVGSAASPATSPAASTVDFDRDVAPILAGRCFDCHNPADRKGKLDLTRRAAAMAGDAGGPAIVAGRPDDAPLWQRVRDDEMPPKRPLPAAEKDVLRRWVAGGAAWGADPVDPFRFTTAARAGRDWWSLRPVTRPEPPKTKSTPTTVGDAWCRNPIDRFVLAKLSAAGLAPSAEADRRTLARRLAFDLTGLPPTAAEMAAFVTDDRPDAYERLVDRLLASPAYGVRFARLWLDVARFGESHGFERDQLRPNAWGYRDWVVDALNADLPYDQFARLQLAGDLLAPGGADGVAATGFLVAGAWDEVGNTQQSAAMRAVVRQDELEDLVGTVAQTFLGVTANCARCHDHKFDPVSQREYYQLAAALSGVTFGERPLPPADVAAAARAATAQADGRAAQIEGELAAIERPARDRLAAASAAAPPVVPPRPALAWRFDGGGYAPEADRSSGLTLIGSAAVRGGALVLDGNGHAVGPPLAADLSAKTLEAWVRLLDLKQRGGGVVGVQTLDGNAFDGIVFGEREPGRWMAGSESFARTRPAGGPEETAAADRFVHVAVAYAADGTIALYRDGRAYGAPYKSADRPVTFAAGRAQVVVGLRHAPAAPGKMLAGAVREVRVYDRGLSPAEVAASAGVTPAPDERELAAALSPEARERRAALRHELTAIRRGQSRAAAKTAWAAVPVAAPAATRLLARGNPAQPLDVVPPSGIAAVPGPPADFGLAPDAADTDRRTKLAAWVTDRRNPLFGRVIVNRLWQSHFGVGIVDTPNDLGFNGGRPTHPELLDWLTAELADHGWSLKHLHRLMVMSAAYRQRSLPRPDGTTADAGNRLLWRMAPRRLEAEAIRDAMLSAAGELNPALGGPGYEDYSTFTNNSTFYEPRDYAGPTFQRRSLYRTWVRSGRNPLLDAFDCPDPSTKTPRRAVTTTPLQALSLMNGSLVLRLSDALAARATREAGNDAANQVAAVYQLVLSRPPTAEESAEAAGFIDRRGLAAFCRVLFNSSEFVVVD